MCGIRENLGIFGILIKVWNSFFDFLCIFNILHIHPFQMTPDDKKYL